MATLSEILEALRHRAEEYTADAVDTRRPSWAPALVINDEFVQQARIVGLLKDDDKPIIRLWAKFADPRKKGTLLREQVGLTLAGVRCRGFEARIGMERKGVRSFWAKRGENADWENGPSRWEENDMLVYSLQKKFLEQKSLCLQFEHHLREAGGPDQQPNLARDVERVRQGCAAREQEYRTAQTEMNTRNTARARLLALSRERVIEFGGGDHLTQMVAGARVTGHCCICGKELTDPVSIERGIGPDCYSKHSVAINAWVASQQNQAA